MESFGGKEREEEGEEEERRGGKVEKRKKKLRLVIRSGLSKTLSQSGLGMKASRKQVRKKERGRKERDVKIDEEVMSKKLFTFFSYLIPDLNLLVNELAEEGQRLPQ